MSAHGEMNVDADLTPSTRSNQKETTNLQAKRTATELLYDTMRVNLGELRLGFFKHDTEGTTHERRNG